MTKKEGFKKFREIQNELFKLHSDKNHDYAKDGYDDNFKDFDWQGVVVRIGDKYSRLKSFIKNKNVKNENIIDSMNDLSVYAIICRILFEKENSKK